MLFNGERVGDGSPPEVDIAVDPLEGTRLAAQGRPSALAGHRAVRARHDVRPRAVRVHGEDGRRQDRRPARPRPPARRDARPDRGPQGHRRARRDGRGARPAAPRGRHPGRSATRALACDSSPTATSAAHCWPSPTAPVDLLWGIGGTPEGVISAAALKCFGGGLIGRLSPRDDAERQAAVDAGYDVDRVLDAGRPRAGDNCFFSATGVTDGDVVEGVRYEGSRGASTESLVMRSRVGDGAAHPVAPRPHQAAHVHRRAVRLSGPGGRQGGTSCRVRH